MRIKGNRPIALLLQIKVLCTTDVLQKHEERKTSRGQNVQTVQAHLKTRKLSQLARHIEVGARIATGGVTVEIHLLSLCLILIAP